MKFTNLIEVIENKSKTPADRMFSVAKRNKNNKRGFLFVNNLLGKHIPVKGSDVLDMFDEFYREVVNTIPSHEKVLIVGFAETATAIGTHIMNRSQDNKLNSVYYIQTTRETIQNLEYISFEEEHSHATTQKLYLNKNIPEFDRVLFVEDEITTGNTILNFIAKFKKNFPNKKYAVASILNIQTDEHLKNFEDIPIIYLVKGQLKDEVQSSDIFLLKDYDYIETKSLYNYYFEIIDKNPRTGLTRDEFKQWLKTQIPTRDFLENTMVIGTEESMYPAILYSSLINGYTRSTTRSPIVPHEAIDYPVYNGVAIPSAYDSDRITYIYNTTQKYNQIIVLTENQHHHEFNFIINNIFKDYSRNPIEVIKTGLKLTFHNFEPNDVTVLLQDIGNSVPVLDNHEREKLNQSGTHYSEMIAKEELPEGKYINLYYDVTKKFAETYYNDFRILIDKILAKKKNPVLVSLARAGTPVGNIIKRILEKDYNLIVPHYTISIIRGKGLDKKAMGLILSKHNPEDIQFIDGWIGKGAIIRELKQSCLEINPNIDYELAVLSDPAHETTLYGTREDYLIPNAIMNSHVSGGISRTIKLKTMTDDELHGTKLFTDKNNPLDFTYYFINEVTKFNKPNFEYTSEISFNDYKGIDEITKIAKEFNIDDVNKVKPGIGETTRVLLRRIPDKILISQNADEKYIKHILELAKDKNIPIEQYDLEHYNVVGIIKSMTDL